MKSSCILLLAVLGLTVPPAAAEPEAFKDFALDRPASASVSAPGHGPEKAVDGSSGTRWTAGRGLPVAPTAETKADMWRWTTERPDEGWTASDFDDSAWRKSRGGFGSAGTPNAVIGTAWSSSDIWLRRQVELTPGDLESELVFRVYHDNDAEVFVNGVRALKLEGHLDDYAMVDLPPEARAALRPGTNILAIHCHQDGGGQFVDAGILRPVQVWWGVDLGAPASIERTEIGFAPVGPTPPFRIEWSLDGEAWNVYADRTETAGNERILVDRKSQILRHLRVVFPEASPEAEPVGISEFRAIGAP